AMYQANTEAYLKELDELDRQYQEAVSSAAYDTLIFGDRFPFRYLVDDYDLNYYAAFAGCSAETEASFETILFLAGKLDELKIPHILKIEGSDGKIAATIVENTKTGGQDILTLNSMQGITSGDIQNGSSYLQIMKNNLEVLKQALN
ncbi:MAG: zinc ABC transporter substrate-binding protein, partial [Solobacterium sp.]|nr:zinc ABC transporter substrate-binding protein [Solobacterium sp.]